MKKPDPKVDAFLKKAGKWQKECVLLREILLALPLTEGFKWGNPCYAYEDRNVVLIHTFKEYCALLFFKGALLKDAKGILIRQTKNVQAARQVRFTQARDITKLKAALKAYVLEAIEVEKSGAKVKMKSSAEFSVAEEFRSRLDGMPALRTAFEALTPGRQKGYLLHFSAAKQSKTRESRVEKCIPMILDGVGLND
jgi:uncharacterized protein YdeI (YjbR/CyaY-like superfamily)